VSGYRSHMVPVTFHIPKSTKTLIDKHAEHFGLSRTLTCRKILELGLDALDEQIQKSSEHLDTGVSKTIHTSTLRKQL